MGYTRRSKQYTHQGQFFQAIKHYENDSPLCKSFTLCIGPHVVDALPVATVEERFGWTEADIAIAKRRIQSEIDFEEGRRR